MKLVVRVTIIVLCLLALLVPSSALAQTSTPALTEAQVTAVLPDLEKYIQDAQSKTGVPGVSVAVVFQDKVLYQKGFGVREAGKTDPVTEDTVFQLASLSKPVGSTVIARLVSDGVVSWDSKISDLDPSFQLYDAYPTSQLTIRDLYSHRSGLPGNAGNELEEIGYSRDEILHRLRFMPPASSFRSGYSYSNFGMTEGGVAAVKPTHKSWEEESKAQLYVPLGMTHTSSSNADLQKETNVAKLHVQVKGAWKAVAVRQPEAQAPAGGVSSTAHDLAQWLILQINQGKYNGEQLIKSDAILETHAPQIVKGTNRDTGMPDFYGLGWTTQIDTSGRIIWTHNGAFTVGARTIATIYPAEKLGIVVLANAFPTGLPEAVSGTFFDLVHYGKPQQDYLTIWEARFKSIFNDGVDAAIKAYATPPANVSPALPDAAYLGTYTNDYLGDVHVTADKKGLVLEVGPAKLEWVLTHWDRDVFLIHPTPEAPDYPSPVTFTIGPDGKATQIQIDELNTNGQGILKRVPDATTQK